MALVGWRSHENARALLPSRGGWPAGDHGGEVRSQRGCQLLAADRGVGVAHVRVVLGEAGHEPVGPAAGTAGLVAPMPSV